MATLADADGRVGVSVKPADLLVYADEGLMGRVVTNLLKRAVPRSSARSWSDVSTCYDLTEFF